MMHLSPFPYSSPPSVCTHVPSSIHQNNELLGSFTWVLAGSTAKTGQDYSLRLIRLCALQPPSAPE